MQLETIEQLPTPSDNKIGWPWTVESVVGSNQEFDGLACPKITIVTPSYNQGQYIEATIRSVLLQGYPKLEYIIMDGGSTDNSVEIIRRYESWLTHWVSEPDNGQSHAVNKGLNQGNGDIFTWLNSDDLLLPGALKQIALAYQNNSGAIGWVGHCHRVLSNGRILNTVVPRGLTRNQLADWFYDGFFYQPACFFSAKAWQAVGGLDESLNFAMDLDLWLRLSEMGQFVAIPETIAAAVIHEEAKTRSQKPEVHTETMYVQCRHGFQEAAVRRLKRVVAASAGQHQGLSEKLKRRIHRLWVNDQNHPQSVRFLNDTSANKHNS
jgi:GT2 family glycosyltransferase